MPKSQYAEEEERPALPETAEMAEAEHNELEEEMAETPDLPV